MDQLQKNLVRLDRFQQKYKPLAFSYAVIKRFGEDQAGYQAALLTYYAFLSLFPLLLILTTVTQLIANNNPALQTSIVHGVTSYFPILGSQLSDHIHSLHKNGLALIIGLLIIFYGARGVADVFRRGVNQIWHLSDYRRGNFFEQAFNSFKIIMVAGSGLVLVSVSAGLSASTGHGIVLRLVSLCLNLVILYGIFMAMFRISLPPKVPSQEFRIAAISATAGIVILQLFGGYLLLHILKNLDALYSYFALSLGLISWIYLQAQVVYYAVEVATVKHHNLWPRSLTGQLPTTADKSIKRGDS